MGTPAVSMSRRAAIFEPIWASTLEGGPTNTMPAFSHAAANDGVLREEPVSGMHGVGAALAGRRDQAAIDR